MTQIIGKILSDRYEVINVLGTGGMATVYEGKDLLLNRMVAIKVLKTEFNSDADFVRKFKQESQAAAKLSHPNIVNVFDVGFDSDLHYIIMELVTGSTLKEYLTNMQGHMKEEAVINIALQVASALSEAHSKEIVHRDIKSQNILVSDKGNIKVTDFGIARATTSATLVNTKEIIGSVHYASPEQARGGFVDARSDIYSLGIMMYELATKHLPFEGESPVAVALQQIKDELPDPKVIYPEISDGLSEIIKKSAAKNPSERYQTTNQLIEDLNALRANQFYVPSHSAHDTMIMPKISQEDIMAHADKRTRPIEKTSNVPVNDTRPNKRNITLVVLAALITAVLLFGIFALSRIKNIFDVPTVNVPNVVGMASEDAVRLLSEYGLNADITDRRFNTEVPVNHVVSQLQPEGQEVKKGFTVTLVISNGAVQKKVPSVINQTLGSAQVVIENEGFAVGKINEVFNDLPEGTVVEQTPRAGLDMPEGTEVELTVSKGPEIRKYIVPSVLGRTIREAESTLNQLGLKLGDITYDHSESVEKGRVIEQEMVGVEVPMGSFVAVVVSEGPKPAETNPTDEPGADDDATQNPEPGDALKQRTIAYVIETLQFDNETETVRIEMVQDGRVKVVYNKEHSKSEGAEINVGFTVEGLGEARIVVYYGSKKVQEEQINF